MQTLTELAIKWGTDKCREDGHHYTHIYDFYFSYLRNKPIGLLEIGYGGWSKEKGYAEPDLGGESAYMWAEYFSKGDVTVIDIEKKNVPRDAPFWFYRGSQTDEEFMQMFTDHDIIIDDGSHRSADVIKTFEIMFPLLNDHGIYVIEDTQTSYWKELSLPNQLTTMEYFKQLCDMLNYNEIPRPGYKPTYTDKHIVSIHFYHNLIFVFKGDNTEPSNTVRNER